MFARIHDRIVLIVIAAAGLAGCGTFEGYENPSQFKAIVSSGKHGGVDHTSITVPGSYKAVSAAYIAQTGRCYNYKHEFVHRGASIYYVSTYIKQQDEKLTQLLIATYSPNAIYLGPTPKMEQGLYDLVIELRPNGVNTTRVDYYGRNQMIGEITELTSGLRTKCPDA